MKKKQMINLAKDALAAMQLSRSFKRDKNDYLASSFGADAEKYIRQIIQNGLVKNHKEGEKLKQE